MSDEVKGDLRGKVQAVIDQIRPLLQADGGDLELVDVTPDGVVKVRLQGACRGCPGAQMTLRMAVERRLKAQVPEVQRVEGVEAQGFPSPFGMERRGRGSPDQR
jgi:Fe-S cluster biogenesis protein NfuA